MISSLYMGGDFSSERGNGKRMQFVTVVGFSKEYVNEGVLGKMDYLLYSHFVGSRRFLREQRHILCHLISLWEQSVCICIRT